MRNKIFFAVLVVTVLFISSCAPKPAGEISETEKEQIKEKDDFGCWPPSCSLISDQQGKQLCEDWKAGKEIQWFDCSAMAAFPKCVKLCEFEKKNSGNVQQDFPQDANDLNYSQYSNYPADEQKDTGIPAEDPGAENVYIYISVFKQNRIIRMEDLTGKGWVSFGKKGKGVGEFEGSHHLSVDPDGKIYIADLLGDRIVRMDDMAGKNLITYGVPGWNRAAGQLQAGEFTSPTSVALDSKNRIYITNQGSGPGVIRIDDMTGKGWTTFGSKGSGAKQLSGPKFMSIDSQDRIYISDKCNYRITRMDDITGKNWVALESAGTDQPLEGCDPTDPHRRGSGVGQFGDEMNAVKVGPDGKIYIADEHNHRIVRIDDMTGKGWIEFKGPPGDPFDQPHGIAFGPTGKIYVTDAKNARVVRFDDMTGKGWIAFAPYAKNWELGYHKWQMEAPKGIVVVPKS